MKGIWKRILCVAIALCMILQPAAYVQAEEVKTENTSEGKTFETKRVNPLYKDVISEEELNDVPEDVPTLYTEPDYVADKSETGTQIRSGMAERLSTITVYTQTTESLDTDEKFNAYLDTLVDAALEETDNPKEGDYLRWQYGGWSAGSSWKTVDDVNYLRINFEFTYYTDEDQEAAVDAKLDEVLWGDGEDGLNLDEGNLSDYEKTKAIYDYICSNVKYDDVNVDNDEYKLQFTAYAALIQKTSVCQGYAVLLYRMLEEAGIDARVIDGIGNGGAHGWNISKLGGKYYYSDATWDAEYVEHNLPYNYFLEGSVKFTEDHAPYTSSPAYNPAYNISETAYDPDSNTGDDTGNEDEGTEDEGQDTISPILKSLKRVAEDVSAPIYTDTKISYEMEFTDGGGTGLEGVKIAFENVETLEEILFSGNVEESGFTDGTIEIESAWDSGEAGTYRLKYVQICDYAGNVASYHFEYDEAENISVHLGDEDVTDVEISDYKFTVLEGTEASLNYKNILVKSVIVNDQNIVPGETVVADITVYNPTNDINLIADPSKWSFEWSYPIAEDHNFINGGNGSGEQVELAPGDEYTFQVSFELNKYERAGKRAFTGITYCEETSDGETRIISYWGDEEKLIGYNNEDKEVHRIPYAGEADFTYENENADIVAPVVNDIEFVADAGENGIIYSNTNLSMKLSCSEEGPSGVSYVAVRYVNQDDEDVIETFYFGEEEGVLVGEDIVLELSNDRRKQGTYKLKEIYIDDNAYNSTSYIVTYTEDGTPMVRKGEEDAVVLSTLWPKMETEYSVEAVPYLGAKITDIRLSDGADSLSAGDSFDITVTFENDTEKALTVEHDTLCMEISDGDGYENFWFPSGSTVIEPGQKADVTAAYNVGKYVAAGQRKLVNINYYKDDICYSIDEETGYAIGKDTYGEVLNSWEYNGKADWNVTSAPNADNEIPVIKSVTTIKEVKEETDKEAIIALEISDEGNAPLTEVWLNFQDIAIEQNAKSYWTELNSSMKKGNIYEIPLKVYDDMVAGEYELRYCEITDDAGNYRAYYREENGQLKDEQNNVLNAENLIIHAAECKDTDFTSPVLKEITFDSTEIKAGETLTGELTVEDESGLAWAEFSFFDKSSGQSAKIESMSMETVGDKSDFEITVSKYTRPGDYKLEYVTLIDDSVRNNMGEKDFTENLEEALKLTVTAADGVVVIDGSESDYENALEQAKVGDTIVVECGYDSKTLPASFLQKAKEKGVKIIIPSACDPGEMIIDPDGTMTEYAEDIVVSYQAYTRVGDPELCDELGVDGIIPIEGIISPANIPVKMRVLIGEQENVTYSLHVGNYYEGYEKIADNLNCKDGYVEIDFPQGIENGVATVSDDSTTAFYYYIGVTTSDECTKHVSDETYTVVKESTCTEAGYKSYHCVNCGEEIEGSQVALELADHTWNGGEVTTPSTCSTEGVRKHTCTLEGCGATKEEAEPCDESNHTYSWQYKIVEMATCTKGALLKICCVECEKEHPALACEEEGCEATHPAVLEIKTWPLPHTYKDKVTKATTKADGKIEAKCSECGYIDEEQTEVIAKPSKMTLSTTVYTYSGSTKKPTVKITDTNGKTISSSNYSISYPSGRKNVGKYTVKVTFKGNYSGTMSASFVINPKKTSMSSVSAASKAFTAKWKKQSTQVTGYQIQYSTSKKFSSAKTVTVSSYKTTSKKVTKLKAKTTYYVRVRTYKTVSGKKYYSDWSSYKSVKTK